MNNAKAKNEIDLVPFDTRNIIRNMTVMLTVSNTGSDNKLVWIRVTFEQKIERKALQMPDTRKERKIFDAEVFQAHMSKEDSDIMTS
ncbi:unnamed protein product [Soboliphyme baturini]|uniref:MSP domain-containing protein n=1 Tax=Soboliphyme baturini TaxID=241478 RepID=A0A183IBH4_9BILA|nr:unnamed protein product [Soboliphyme baturini]